MTTTTDLLRFPESAPSRQSKLATLYLAPATRAKIERGTHFVVRVVGDSMEPTLRDGWALLANRNRRPENDDITAVYIVGEGSLVGRWEWAAAGARLLKDNPSHEPVELGPSSQWRVVGVVERIISAPVKEYTEARRRRA